MIDVKGYYGVNYTKESFSQYSENLLSLAGWNRGNLGVASDPQYNIYDMTLKSNVPGKPYIILRSAVHGNEWESAYWCLDFARFLGNPKLAPAKLEKYFTLLKNEYNFYWIPIHNPWGYENNNRLNNNNINLNDDLGALTQVENIYLVNKFNEYKPIVIVDNHSWDDPFTPCHAMSIYEPNQYDRLVCRAVFNHALKTVQYNTEERVREYASSGHDPTKFRSWAARRESSSGVNCMVWLIETERLADVKKQTRQGFNALLIFLLSSNNWFRRNIQNTLDVDI